MGGTRSAVPPSFFVSSTCVIGTRGSVKPSKSAMTASGTLRIVFWKCPSCSQSTGRNTCLHTCAAVISAALGSWLIVMLMSARTVPDSMRERVLCLLMFLMASEMQRLISSLSDVVRCTRCCTQPMLCSSSRPSSEFVMRYRIPQQLTRLSSSSLPSRMMLMSSTTDSIVISPMLSAVSAKTTKMLTRKGRASRTSMNSLSGASSALSASFWDRGLRNTVYAALMM
mmetsp:Transcript_43926/g.138043  ORF Transcript_43926/g.138043 Transcript_43926/m.138043 type:complete len:226 (+) Transcript_43926:2208-2885(+)